MRPTPLRLLLPLVLLTPVFAEDAPPRLLEELQRWVDAPTPEARAEAALRMTLAGTTPAQVHQALPRVRRFAPPDSAEAAAGRVVRWERTTGADRRHTVFARAPASYDPATGWPVLIWLHGGVRRDTDGGGEFGVTALGERADAHGFIVVSPSAYGGVAWWTPEGVRLVRGALDDAKARWRVDPNRVFVTGFSDGASGCFHLLAHDPDPYAAFLPLMGHPAFTRMLGGPTYAANVQSRPVFAVNGGKDTLYPSSSVKPLIDGLKQAGCDLTWKNLPEATHSLSHVAEVWDELWAFAVAHPRQALHAERQLAWFQPDVHGRLDWIEVLRVDPRAPGEAELEARELVLPKRLVLGVRVDRAFPGPGLRIASVEEASAAEAAGVLAGDVIRRIGDTELGGAAEALASLRRLLTVTDGTQARTLTLTVVRDGKDVVLTLAARVPSGGGSPRPKALGFDRPVGRIAAKRDTRSKITLRTRAIGALRLHLSHELVDLDKPLEVFVNGKRRFHGLVKPDLGYALGEIRRAGGAAPHNVATLVLRP